MRTPLLNLDDTMIERMEADLVSKVQAAYNAAGVEVAVYGVFSLDDLEKKQESELCGAIGIGVGYLGAEPTGVDTNPKAALNVSRGEAMKALDFMYMIILAVPTNGCDERFPATKLLTIMRRKIMGSTISGDEVNRTWAFVKEGPQISESSDTMLYYSQVWRVALPQTGNVSNL